MARVVIAVAVLVVDGGGVGKLVVVVRVVLVLVRVGMLVVLVGAMV